MLIEGLTLSDIAEVFTALGQAIGEVASDAKVNPEWLELGPARDITFITHANFLPSAPQG